MSAQTDSLDRALELVTAGIADHVTALAAARDQSQNAAYLEGVTARLTQLASVLSNSSASS